MRPVINTRMQPHAQASSSHSRGLLPTFSRRPREQLLAGSWLLMLMQASENEHVVELDDIEDGVREAAQGGAPDLVFDLLVQRGVGSEVGFGALQGTQEGAGLIDVGLGVPG